jgi:hypothetical protein
MQRVNEGCKSFVAGGALTTSASVLRPQYQQLRDVIEVPIIG